MERIVHISNFDKGLVTNVDQGDLPLNSMVKLQNVRNDKPGMLRGVPGFVKFADLPSTIEGDVRFFQEVVINDTQTLICWGVDSGGSVQHRNYSTDTGSTWTEITEMVFCEVASATSAKQFIIRADGSDPFNDTPSTVNDTYNDWFLYFHDAGTPGNDSFGYVTDYIGSTAEIFTEDNLAGTPVANDPIILMRFPLHNFADLQDLADGTLANRAAFDDYRNFVRDDNNFKPTIIQRENAIAIHNGRRKDTLTVGVDNHTALWFGYVDLEAPAQNFFNNGNTNLNFTGLHAERLFLDAPDDTVMVLSITTNAGTPSLPAADYGCKISLIYDGFQETRIFLADGDQVPSGEVATVSSGETYAVTVDFDAYPSVTAMANHHGFRRINAIRVYIATVDSDRIPTSPWFFVDEISLFSTAWSSDYRAISTITNAELTAGKKNEAELIHGYFSEIRVSEDLATVVDGKEVVSSLVVGTEADNEEKKNYLIYPAINKANRVTPDAHPESDIKDMSEHGIYEIFNIKPLNNLLAVYGEKKLVILNGTEEVDSHEGRGVNGFWSVVSKGEKLFWGNLDSMYELVQGGRPNEIGFPIRGDWQAISAANRKKSIAVYDNKFNTFILHSPSGTTYIYDESRKSWRTYVSSTTFEWFSIGVDGEVLATDKTDIFHLFPDSGSTETLTGTVEWILDFEDYSSIKFIEIMYKLTGVITVKVFDLEKSDSYHIAEVKFFAKTEFDNEPQKLSFRAKKIRLQLTIVPTAASNFDYEIDSISLHGTKSIQVNQ